MVSNADQKTDVLPHALEAEISLLGALILDCTVLADVTRIIPSAAVFMSSKHAMVYDSIMRVVHKHGALDLVLLNQDLVDRKHIEDMGGADALVKFAEGVPSANHATHYAQLVMQAYRCRRATEIGQLLAQDSRQRPHDIEEILSRCQGDLFVVSEVETKASEQTLAQAMMDSFADLDRAGAAQGVLSGFVALDELTGGFYPGDMVIIAGRPSMGKTALAINIAEGAMAHGVNVLVFSLEMSKRQLVDRMLGSRSGVEPSKIRRGMVTKDDVKCIQTAANEILELPGQMVVDDGSAGSVAAMRIRCRRLCTKHKIGMIVIDYLQLMTGDRRGDNRQVEVSEISRNVKAMAREMNIPVIAISQLNRAAEMRDGNRPRLSDLRESGSIEQDADTVILLHREAYYHRDDEQWIRQNTDKLAHAEAIVAKARNGPTGKVELNWSSRLTRFRNAHTSPVMEQEGLPL